MTNTAMWALIVGFFLPVGIAVIQQKSWSTGFRAIVGFLMCLVAAAGQILIQVGDWDWHTWIKSSLLIFVTAISTYESFWKKTGIAPSVETSTTPKGGA